jgi:peptide/nickel transport system permease protein
MLPYVLRRLSFLFFVLLALSAIVFLLLALVPGDPALAILGPYATAERLTDLRRELGVEQDPLTRYLSWLARLLHGDLGRSFAFDRSVSELVLERLGPTLLLAGTALGTGTALGLGAGALAAAHRGSVDRVLTLLSLAGISTPAFWLSLIFVLLFAVTLPWFPVSGMTAAVGAGAGSVADVVHHLVLPSGVLALVIAGIVARLMRAQMLEALSQDYTRVARARGLPEAFVRYRHAFRSAAVHMVPVIGLQAGYALGGAIYVESVFQWPGLGRLLVEAILKRDLLLVQGGALVLAATYVLVNLATDLVHHALDPRTLEAR